MKGEKKMNAFVYDEKVYKQVPVAAIMKTPFEDFYLLDPEIKTLNGQALYKIWGVPVYSFYSNAEIREKIKSFKEGVNVSRLGIFSYPRTILISGNFIVEYLDNCSIFVEVLEG
jgi:hypothetical protein